MKKLILSIFILSVVAIQAQSSDFNSLLQENVDKQGNVDYKSLKNNESDLDLYLNYLSKTTPSEEWSKNKEKAFWINAYNAYTLKIILNNYPLKSITNIKIKDKTAWKIPFVNIGGKSYTLDFVEHEILRKKFNDARIHVGVNCASKSCPKLGNIAFTENNIESELERLMKEFINDTTKNKISQKKIIISEIFNWFPNDFTKEGSLIDYINKYSEITVNEKAQIKYLTYDWSLNEK
jgi:hypothetical protein